MSTPHTPSHDDSPIAKLLITVSGASGAEHESAPPGVQPICLKAGHEPDQFDVRAILLVPGFTTVVLLLTYAIVTGVFFSIKDPAPDPNANPVLAKELAEPTDDRFARVSSSDPNADVKQPRLESFRRQGHPDEPAYFRSRLPVRQGNTHEITPQDLRPDRYIDATTGTKLLVEYGWADKEKKLVHIPIEQAMTGVLSKLPVAKGAKDLRESSVHQSKLSNSGRGGLSDAPAAPEKH